MDSNSDSNALSELPLKSEDRVKDNDIAAPAAPVVAEDIITPPAAEIAPLVRGLSEAEEESSEDSADEEDDEHDHKRPKHDDKSTNPEKVFATTTQRREQNRLHARNTRERKKLLLDRSHLKINQLYEERSRLCAILAERTGEIPGQFISKKTAAEDKESKDQLKEIDNAMKKVEDSQDITMDNLSAEQLWNIRKEKNRIHARKTRLRKKLALDEAESTLRQLTDEITTLRAKVSAATGNSSGYPTPQGMNFPPPGGMPNNFSVINSSMSSSFLFPQGMNQNSGHGMQMPMSMSMSGMSGTGMPWGSMQMQRDGFNFNMNMGGYMPQYPGMQFNQFPGMRIPEGSSFPNIMRGFMSGTGSMSVGGRQEQMPENINNLMKSATNNPGGVPRPS